MKNTVTKMIAILLMLTILSASMISCSTGGMLGEIFSKDLSKQATWLDGLSADDVTRIDIKEKSSSIAPGRLDGCYYTEKMT